MLARGWNVPTASEILVDPEEWFIAAFAAGSLGPLAVFTYERYLRQWWLDFPFV